MSKVIAFIQIDDITMGSVLDPLLANNFKSLLEENLLGQVASDTDLSERYVTDIICLIATNYSK